MRWFEKVRWSPYIVGGLIGILAWVVFGYMDETLSVSTAFVHAAILIENWIIPDHAAELTYFKETLSKSHLIDWQFAFVLGIFPGSFLAGYLARSFNTKIVTEIWGKCFGYSRTKRFAGAFLGGIILMFGARLGGGCTSGHGISGGLMLAISSWIFILFAFITGIFVSLVLYRTKKDSGRL